MTAFRYLINKFPRITDKIKEWILMAPNSRNTYWSSVWKPLVFRHCDVHFMRNNLSVNYKDILEHLLRTKKINVKCVLKYMYISISNLYLTGVLRKVSSYKVTVLKPYITLLTTHHQILIRWPFIHVIWIDRHAACLWNIPCNIREFSAPQTRDVRHTALKYYYGIRRWCDPQRATNFRLLYGIGDNPASWVIGGTTDL